MYYKKVPVICFVLQVIIFDTVYPAMRGCNYMGCRSPCQDEKNDSCVSGYHFFREKVRPFPHLAKAVNNRIETESEENDYGTDKKEWSEINEDWRLCVWQMEGKSTARI